MEYIKKNQDYIIVVVLIPSYSVPAHLVLNLCLLSQFCAQHTWKQNPGSLRLSNICLSKKKRKFTPLIQFWGQWLHHSNSPSDCLETPRSLIDRECVFGNKVVGNKLKFVWIKRDLSLI